MTAPSPSDEDLMRRLQRGDQDAYTELYRRWRLPIFRFLLRRTCSRSHAEEALQETWTRLYRYRRSYDPGRPFRSWLYRVASNAGHDARRPQPEQLFLREDLLEASYSTQQQLQVRNTLIVALHRLSPSERRLLLLVGEGFTSSEVSEILKIPPSTVRTHLSRARRSIREALDG